jgi:hypothetical protein
MADDPVPTSPPDPKISVAIHEKCPKQEERQLETPPPGFGQPIKED